MHAKCTWTWRRTVTTWTLSRHGASEIKLHAITGMRGVSGPPPLSDVPRLPAQIAAASPPLRRYKARSRSLRQLLLPQMRAPQLRYCRLQSVTLQTLGFGPRRGRVSLSILPGGKPGSAVSEGCQPSIVVSLSRELNLMSQLHFLTRQLLLRPQVICTCVRVQLLCILRAACSLRQFNRT